MLDFKDIIGNEPIKEYFQSVRKNQKISHAYILEGEKGCGKKSIVAAFSKVLQCKEGKDEPCGVCESCIQMDHKNHPDVVWVQHEKPNNISVQEIREQVVNTVDVKPYKDKYKIYIIDEAEKMNVAAQNAILKTIEEPPEYVLIFLLSANRGAFLPTILSRCVVIDVKPLQNRQIIDYLTKNKAINNSMAHFYAGFAMGNLGKAITISSSEDFQELKEISFRLVTDIYKMKPQEIDEQIKILKQYKNNIQDFFDIMLMWFRDVLVYATTKEEERLIFKNDILEIKEQQNLLKMEDYKDIFEKIDQTKRRIHFNVNLEGALESLLLEIRRMFLLDCSQ